MHIKSKIPELKEYIAANASEYAVTTADQTVNYAHALIPTIGILVKDQLDTFPDAIIQELSTNYIPAINEYFRRHQDTILAHLDTLSDEKLAKQLSIILINTLNQEMSLICGELDRSVFALQREIESITNKPDYQLTKKEYAEKKFLIYWMFIVKHGEVGNALLDISLSSD